MSRVEFALSEEEFYKLENALLHVRMVAALAAAHEPNGGVSNVPITCRELVAFLSAIEDKLSPAVKGAEERMKAETTLREALAAQAHYESPAAGIARGEQP